MGLRPFFSYYGAKWRAAKWLYPAPSHPMIVEPFAGSAGYSLRHPSSDVLLVDADEVIAGVWDYIINATEREVRALPLEVECVDDLPIPREAQALIGFWLNHGASRPCKTPGAWMRAGSHDSSFWGEAIRDRVARQQKYVRHWKVLHGDYSSCPDVEATWFVDPPYEGPPGRHYVHDEVDFKALSAWILQRQGQVIACEQEGATWLPFSAPVGVKSTKGRSREVVFVKGGTLDLEGSGQ